MQLRKESFGKKTKRSSVSRKKKSSTRRHKSSTRQKSSRRHKSSTRNKSTRNKSTRNKSTRHKSTRNIKQKSIPTNSADTNLDTIYIRFAVTINNDVSKAYASNHVSSVLQWYNHQIAFYKGYNHDVRQLDVTHEHDNIFRLRCVYDTSRGPIDLELQVMVIDPDHDGNSPILLNGTEYLVRGRVL
jgi:hypothetical protein